MKAHPQIVLRVGYFICIVIKFYLPYLLKRDRTNDRGATSCTYFILELDTSFYIVHRSIIHQPFQFTALVHFPCNFSFYQSAVNGDHTAIREFDFHTCGVDIELAGKTFLSITVSS